MARTRTDEEAIVLRPMATLMTLKLLVIGVVTVAAMALAPAGAPGSAASTSFSAEIMRRASVTLPVSRAGDVGAIETNSPYVEQVERFERDGEIVTLITVVINL